MARTFRALGQALARAAEDKKAEDVLLLDVRKQSPLVEYMLIATVNSPPHLEAVEHAVSQAARDLRCPALRQARPASSSWRVLDFGGILAHFMTEEARRFYSLERLYHRASPVPWQEPRKKTPRPARRQPSHA